MNLFRRKNVVDLQTEAQANNPLNRALGPLNLISLGVGVIIGTGIFVLTGTVAAQNAGPAVLLSFVLAGIVSVFAALCYSEFASLVPMAGSAYTYSYATLGEVIAWIIGWDLILEYAVGAIAVAVGWSGYVVSFLHDFGVNIPPSISNARGTELIEIPAALAPALKMSEGWTVLVPGLAEQIKAVGGNPNMLLHATAAFNLLAVSIVFVVTTLLIMGIKASANFNNVIVFIKMIVVLLFIVGAAHAITTAHWHPFIPVNTGQAGHFGWSGVMTGAGIVFFAFLGFDAVSTVAQEAKNPRRDLPIGIIGSLLVCTVLYILVSAIATGVVPYQQLDVPDPIAVVADRAGMGWMGTLIKLGAIAGLSSVILVMLLAQSRIFYSMSRDGLLPPLMSNIHPRFRTPWITSIIIGAAVAIFSAFFTVREAGSLCSIGTLLAFVIVSIGVIVLRLREPDLPRKFKTPMVWFVAPACALSAMTLMASLPWPTWRRLIVWFVIGILIYFSYGIRKSRLAKANSSSEIH